MAGFRDHLDGVDRLDPDLDDPLVRALIEASEQGPLRVVGWDAEGVSGESVAGDLRRFARRLGPGDPQG